MDAPTARPDTAEDAPAPRRRPMQFRSKHAVPRLDRDSVVRQGEITRIAWLRLGKDKAIAFLNGHDEALGGRPLDLATASDAGLKAVAATLDAPAGG